MIRIAITNRSLCERPFLVQLKRLCTSDYDKIILREKDLSKEAYLDLAQRALEIFQDSGKELILHSYVESALTLGCKSIHLPYPKLLAQKSNLPAAFQTIGCSIHSLEEAKNAERLGCTYLTAGHIFETNCKAGLPGRGLDWLSTITSQVSIPVYAIGGITEDTMASCIDHGASGICQMSEAMKY